jgi:uncharacterized protein YecE (DUF72 family)
MKKGQTVRVGCSGWQYKDWRGRFYPITLPQKEWLKYYAEAFDTVEVNNSFYRLPTEETFSSWRERTPDNFLFAVKASRYLTHLKRLKEPSEPLKLFWERARFLEAKLGPVLYQLPPRWERNEKRFFEFLDALPKERLQTVEFRDPSWYTDAVLKALEERGIVLCLHDMPGSAPPRQAIGPFVYVRFHGTEAKYRGGYPDGTLREWAGWLAEEVTSGKSVYAYFNNDVGGHAIHDAQTLKNHLESILQLKAA